MPVQQGKSAFLSSIKPEASKALRDHAADDADFGSFAPLPEIKNGTAKLTQCRIEQIPAGRDNAGKWEFRARGQILLPEEVTGRLTFIQAPLFDTPERGGDRKTQEDHLLWVQNELKKLGVTDPKALQIENLESTVKKLEKDGPYFHFSHTVPNRRILRQMATGPNKGKWFLIDEVTGQPVKGRGPYASEEMGKAANKYAGADPRGFHNWNGKCEYNNETPEGGDVEDSSGAAPAPKNRIAGKIGANGQEETSAGFSEFSPEEEVEALLTAANNEDSEAQDKLRTLAMEAGHSEEEVDAAENWEAVAEMVSNPASESGESESSEGEEYTPKLNDVCFFDVMDPKTKKSKEVECTIIKVYPKEKAVDLQNIQNQKLKYLKKPWDAIRPVSV